ncbi:ATP-binding protein [Paraburkholderia sediminicola]|uniref:AlbA family DNA-binding domain-containing protein n=1 Tax=Paraburkholderia sediminicola TaxID=458836 RepID=UPI0038BB7318
MLHKADIRDVTFADLEALRDNQVPESHTLDYKRDFPSDREGRVSLAADVVAFANTRGGDLILGVVEKEGVIQGFAPIPLEDRDEALLGLQSALTDLVEPKVPGVQLAAVQIDGGFIVIVRTPPSFQAPHRVRKNSVFYARTSTGIDPMDITTLRSAFLQSATAAEKASNFRADRIKHMRIRPLPGVLPARTLAVLHVLPMASILGSASYGIADLYPIAQHMRPPVADGWGPRINLDGVMSFCGRDEILSYVQVFRNGALESVMPVQWTGSDTAWVGGIEDSLIEGHHAGLVDALSKLGLDGPAFVMLSFIGIGGKPLEMPGTAAAVMAGGAAIVPPYYENLLLPELFVESFASSTAALYGPLIDLVWNTAGRQKRPQRR